MQKTYETFKVIIFTSIGILVSDGSLIDQSVGHQMHEINQTHYNNLFKCSIWSILFICHDFRCRINEQPWELYSNFLIPFLHKLNLVSKKTVVQVSIHPFLNGCRKNPFVFTGPHSETHLVFSFFLFFLFLFILLSLSSCSFFYLLVLSCSSAKGISC